MHKPILLFDGVCHLCNGIVQFVIRRDPEGRFLFASLQSEAGQYLLKRYNLSTDSFSSFVYVQGNQCYLRSTAALMVTKKLKGFWSLGRIGFIFPTWFRDRIYQLIANRRYQWFGKRQECMIPTPDLKRRFVETEKDVEKWLKNV